MPALFHVIFHAYHRFVGSNSAVIVSKDLYRMTLAAYHQTVTIIFFWVIFAFGKCLRVSSLSNLCPGRFLLSYRIDFSSHVTIRSRKGSKKKQKNKTDKKTKQNKKRRTNKTACTHLCCFTFPRIARC